MEYKQKLISLLKTNEEVKKDLEKLRFGTYIKNHIDIFRLIGTSEPKMDGYNITYYQDRRYATATFNGKIKDFEIIGNPLEEKHLRIYCKSNGIRFNTQENDVILLRKGSANETYFGFEGNKSINNQSEEVYERVFNFLNENKNEK